MNGTCNVLDDYKPQRKPQLPEQHPRRRWMIEAAWLLVGLIVIVCVWQYFRGVVDEYDSMTRKLVAAETRAASLKTQLDSALRHGADGILVANIGADLAGYQLRLVPGGRR